MDLNAGASAAVEVDPATTAGSRLTVRLVDAEGGPLDATRVQLSAALPDQDIAPLDIPLDEAATDHWHGEFPFPFAGEWTLTLTVENQQQVAVVTSGALTIG
jgi:hypothetical protein